MLSVSREPIGAHVNEAWTFDRRTVGAGNVEQQIRVHAGTMRKVRKRRAPAARRRKIANGQHASGALRSDQGRGAFDCRDETRLRPVTTPDTKPAQAGRQTRQLLATGQDTANGRPDGTAPQGLKWRGRGSAASRCEQTKDPQSRRLASAGGGEPRAPEIAIHESVPYQNPWPVGAEHVRHGGFP
jgi:hypothetical protein